MLADLVITKHKLKFDSLFSTFVEVVNSKFLFDTHFFYKKCIIFLILVILQNLRF